MRTRRASHTLLIEPFEENTFDGILFEYLGQRCHVSVRIPRRDNTIRPDCSLPGFERQVRPEKREYFCNQSFGHAVHMISFANFRCMLYSVIT